MDLPRSSGVQLHPTSLPGGRLGPEARTFADWLASAGQAWWQMLPLGPPDRYGSPYKARSAFAASPRLLESPGAPVSKAEELDFREREAAWIEDWIAFSGRGALADQVRFDREWSALRAYASERGVRLIGDVPIYVAAGSADQRAHPELFTDDFVAGVPPDAFTDKGQLWGNPLYDWPALRRRGGYGWWIERLRRTFALFDLARIDHFRGFVSYWAVPRGARYALAGSWKRGPGRAPFEAATAALGELPVIAEDLGVITPAVQRLRDSLGYPGMVILQWGFDADPDSVHRLANHAENRIAYTGTHDNDTLRGWYESISDEARARVDAALRPIGHDAVWWGLIRLTFGSRARVAMVQAQDVLGLGSEGRMNQPGKAAGAWKWRLRDGALTPALAARLRDASDEAGRLP